MDETNIQHVRQVVDDVYRTESRRVVAKGPSISPDASPAPTRGTVEVRTVKEFAGLPSGR